MVRDGSIFILGGDDEWRQPSNKVYRVEISSDGKLINYEKKQNMIYGVYDFSICQSDTHIYVTGGKGAREEIVAHVQWYNLDTDTWELMSPARSWWYASSTVYMKG